MSIVRRVPRRRGQARCVRRICDIGHLLKRGSKPTSEELDKMDAQRRQLCKLSRRFHDEERKDAAAMDDMKRRLISMGMVIRKEKAVA